MELGHVFPDGFDNPSNFVKLFKDDLFIKTSRGVTPTSRAIELAQPIRQALEQIQFVVSSQPEFDPALSDRTFRFGMDDYTEIVFLPKVLQEIKLIAPNVRIQIRYSNWQKAPKLLDADEIDLAIGYCPQHQTWHQRQTLYEERFICVANTKRFKKGKAIALEEYVTASHLFVSPKEDMVGMVDEILVQQNLPFSRLAMPPLQRRAARKYRGRSPNIFSEQGV